MIRPALNHAMLTTAAEALMGAGKLEIDEVEGIRPERFVRVTLPGGVPALIYVKGCYRDEWVASIALWPTADAESHMRTSRGGAAAGRAFAWGWLNRWQFDGKKIGVERFHDAAGHVPHNLEELVASLIAQPYPTS